MFDYIVSRFFLANALGAVLKKCFQNVTVAGEVFVFGIGLFFVYH